MGSKQKCFMYIILPGRPVSKVEIKLKIEKKKDLGYIIYSQNGDLRCIMVDNFFSTYRKCNPKSSHGTNS